VDRIHFGTMLDQEILIVSQRLFPDSEPIPATVRGAEAGGIWVESQKITDLMLRLVVQQSMSEVTPVVFVPFSSIDWILTFKNIPSISSEGIAE
jgi:hypothetical protein